MSGGIHFVLPYVRGQRENEGKLTKKSQIIQAFGPDAGSVFEPFTRAYIPKFFNESPTIPTLTVFMELFAHRMEQPLRLMLSQDMTKYLNFAGLGKSLYNNYEQFALSICEIVRDELTNPSFSGFGSYCAYPLLNRNTEAFYQPYVSEAKQLLLTAGTFSSYDTVDGLIFTPSFKQGKKQVYYDGWFSYFFLCVEEVSNKKMSLPVMFEKKSTLEEMILFFKGLDYRQNQKLVKQPILLLFAIINMLNIKHTPPTYDVYDPTRKHLVPFMSLTDLATWQVHFHPLFIGTLESIIYSETFKGSIDTPGAYRAMLQSTIHERVMSHIDTDMIMFDSSTSIYAEQAMIMCQVCLPSYYL